MAARTKQLPTCNFTLDGVTCRKRGAHVCIQRAKHCAAFFEEILVHTKGRWARTPFRLSKWQYDDIIKPLMGSVVWSVEHGMYVRRYRIAWIEVARKNGKSELLAGLAIYLLVADGEESAEVYGAACDRDQARKVYDVAKRMSQLSPVLDSVVKTYEQAKRMVFESQASYYEIVSADAAGNLGHNPHGIVFDEVLTQKNGALWHSLRTGMGARVQPLMIGATTAGDDPQSFAKEMHDEMALIAEDPERAPHMFVYLRNVPQDADPWDESLWHLANPALGEFLSIEALREEALEAKNDPSKENAFRQFRLNQWVSQATRWMPIHLWDANCQDLWLNSTWKRDAFRGRTAFAGFDLSSKMDLTAWCLLVPPGLGAPVDEPVHAFWRFWVPEDGLRRLDKLNDGKFSRWAKQGWLSVLPGTVIDYDQVAADIKADAEHFRIPAIDCDEWSMWPMISRVGDVTGLDPDHGEILAYRNTFDRMSAGMTDLMALAKQHRLEHHGNPLARFCFDNVEVKCAAYDANLLRPVKPDRGRERSRIDGVPAAIMAANALRRSDSGGSAYESRGLMVL